MPSTRPGGQSESYLDWVLLVKPATDVTTEVAESNPDANGKSWVSSVTIAPKARERMGAGAVGCEFVATQAMTVLSLCRLPTPNSNNIMPVKIFTAAGELVASAA